jgi:hypothetical protein
MYQWRKFDFFKEKAAGRGGAPAVPAEIAGRVTCSRVAAAASR